jgi:hypothetical protein
MRHLFYLIFLFVFFLESCNAFYVPASPHVPMLRGKKDFCQHASLGTSGINEAVSYSPVNHFYFGGTGHVFYSANNKHFSGGPHLGCYLNPFGGSIHLNFQTGYGWGSSEYANPISGSDVSGDADYNYYYLQAFIAFNTKKNENSFFGIGGQYSASHFIYSSLYYRSSNGPIPGSLPVNQGFGSAFFFVQKNFFDAPHLRFFWMGGYQFATPELSDPDLGGFIDGNLYLSFCCRLGLTYQIQFGKKQEAPEK